MTQKFDVSLDPNKHALLFDIDGTLLDIQRNFQDVNVPHQLKAKLESLSFIFDGAIALISGRSIDTIIQLFGNNLNFYAGCHGCEILNNGTLSIIDETVFSIHHEIHSCLERSFDLNFICIENKRYSVAVHNYGYPDLHLKLQEILSHNFSKEFKAIKLQSGKNVVEIVPKSIDKSIPVNYFLSQNVFKNRVPVYFGDDATDEAAFGYLNKNKGISVKIGESDTSAQFYLNGPAEVRKLITDVVVTQYR